MKIARSLVMLIAIGLSAACKSPDKALEIRAEETPAAGFDSGHWHDVFVIDLEDPPCLREGNAIFVSKTAQVDAVYQGTGPKPWYALVGHRVTVEGVADTGSRPHHFEPVVFDPGVTLIAAK